MAIQVQNGTEYRCAVVNEDLIDLGKYGGREVTVLGKAIYRPSGTVLRLDVQQVLDTTVGRSAHSEVHHRLTGLVAQKGGVNGPEWRYCRVWYVAR